MASFVPNLYVFTEIALAPELLGALVTMMWLFFHVHNINVLIENLFSTEFL